MSRRLVIVLLVALCLAAGKASAKTYVVRLCSDPAEPGFTLRNDNPAAFTATTECPPRLENSSTGAVAMLNPGVVGPLAGQTVAWTVTAPPGTSFDNLSLMYSSDRRNTDYELVFLDGAEDASVDCSHLRSDPCRTDDNLLGLGRST